MSSFTALHFPHHQAPFVVKHSSDIASMEEYLSLSPNHCLLYNINRSDPTPNEGLAKYGGIVTNIPGDAVLIKCDEEGENVDIEGNILELLPELIANDVKQRANFLENLTSSQW